MASLGNWPAAIRPRTCLPKMEADTFANAAGTGGDEQVLDNLRDRWTMALTLPVRRHADAAAVEAFLNSFRGLSNWVYCWHFTRPAPRGTLRGTLVTLGTQAQGAAVLVLSGGTPGGTVLDGDMFGAGGQLVQASANATADGSGVITIPIVNRLRAAIATGQSATWDKPTAPFRLLSHSGVRYVPGSAEEVTLMLGEKVGA